MLGFPWLALLLAASVRAVVTSTVCLSYTVTATVTVTNYAPLRASPTAASQQSPVLGSGQQAAPSRASTPAGGLRAPSPTSSGGRNLPSGTFGPAVGATSSTFRRESSIRDTIQDAGPSTAPTAVSTISRTSTIGPLSSTDPSVLQSTFYLTFTAPADTRRQLGLLYMGFDFGISYLYDTRLLAALFYMSGGTLRTGTMFVAMNGGGFVLQIFPPLVPLYMMFSGDGRMIIPGTDGFCRMGSVLNVLSGGFPGPNGCQGLIGGIEAAPAGVSAPTTTTTSDEIRSTSATTNSLQVAAGFTSSTLVAPVVATPPILLTSQLTTSPSYFFTFTTSIADADTTSTQSESTLSSLGRPSTSVEANLPMQLATSSFASSSDAFTPSLASSMSMSPSDAVFSSTESSFSMHYSSLTTTSSTTEPDEPGSAGSSSLSIGTSTEQFSRSQSPESAETTLSSSSETPDTSTFVVTSTSTASSVEATSSSESPTPAEMTSASSSASFITSTTMSALPDTGCREICPTTRLASNGGLTYNKIGSGCGMMVYGYQVAQSLLLDIGLSDCEALQQCANLVGQHQATSFTLYRPMRESTWRCDVGYHTTESGLTYGTDVTFTYNSYFFLSQKPTYNCLRPATQAATNGEGIFDICLDAATPFFDFGANTWSNPMTRQQCIDYCMARGNCVGFAHHRPGLCWTKSTYIQQANGYTSGVRTNARRTNYVCPDQATFISSNGVYFTACRGYDMPTNMGRIIVETRPEHECVNRCGEIADCGAWAHTGNICTLHLMPELVQQGWEQYDVGLLRA